MNPRLVSYARRCLAFGLASGVALSAGLLAMVGAFRMDPPTLAMAAVLGVVASLAFLVVAWWASLRL